MKCDLINRESIISKYLMNELSEDENLKFEEHYFKCEDCFKELQAAEDALNLIKNEGFAVKERESSNSFIEKIFSEFKNPARLGIAFASISIIFVLFYVFYNLNSNKTEIIIADDGRDSVKQIVEQKPIQKEEETTDQQKESELLASLTGPAFEPNPYYEELINENVRSGNDVIEIVLSPQNNSRFYNNVVFKWKMKTKAYLILSIIKNTEEKGFSTEIDTTAFPEIIKTVTSDNFRKSGLYYWRIENEFDVLYVGKFYFIKRK